LLGFGCQALGVLKPVLGAGESRGLAGLLSLELGVA
jgi:hypothetical protein